MDKKTSMTLIAPDSITSSTNMPSFSSLTGIVEHDDSPASKQTRTTQDILGEERLATVDKESLAMLLCFQLVKQFEFTKTKTADFTATMLNKGEQTVCRWQSDGVLPEFK